MITAVDLFAGGGGAALGLRRAGVQCLAHVEWDGEACATLRAAVAAGMLDGDVIEGDVRAVDWAPYVGADLVWASPPCQAWSSAGQRKGAQDERNGWPWTWDAVDQIRPTWLLCENVPGLLDHLSAGHPGDVNDPNPDACSRCYWDGVILPEARRRFAHVEWRVLDAADYAVPQRRHRLILVCGPRSYRWPAPTHRDPAAWLVAGRPWVTVREALGATVERNTTAHGPGGRVADRARVDTYLHAADPGVRAPRATLAGSEPWRLDMPSPCVTAIGEMKGSGDGGSPHKMQRASDALYLGLGRRRLTPHECAALQAFPPDWLWQGTKTAIYRQIGNAVPPMLAEVLAGSIVPREGGRRG